MQRLLGVLLALVVFTASAQAQTVTHGVWDATTSNGTAYTTSIFTPADGDLLIFIAAMSGTVATGTLTDSQAGTWTLVNSATKSSGTDTLAVFIRDSTVTNSAMQIAIDVSADGATGAVTEVLRVSGITRTGISAIRQSAVQSNVSGGATPTGVFAAPTLNTNPVIGAVINGANPAGLTEPVGFTEVQDVGYATPATGAEFVKVNSGYASDTLTWGDVSASAFGLVVLEVDASEEGGAGGGGDCAGNLLLLGAGC